MTEYVLGKKIPITLFAISILLLGNLLATVADGFVKEFGDAAGIYQYLFLRQILLALMIAPAFFRQTSEKRRLSHRKIHFLRGNLTVIGGACVVLALMNLSLAAANVVFYTAPVLTLLFAAILFKEKLHRHRLINIALCFAGVLIALRPDQISVGIIAAFVAAICIALYNLTVRYLPRDVPTASVMFWGCVFSIPMLGVLSVFNWQPWSSDLVFLVFGSALSVGCYQYCCVIAYRNAEAGAIAIAEYSGLVFAGILGWLWFAEVLDLWTVLGMCCIILPIMWQSKIESRKRLLEVENRIT